MPVQRIFIWLIILCTATIAWAASDPPFIDCPSIRLEDCTDFDWTYDGTTQPAAFFIYVRKADNTNGSYKFYVRDKVLPTASVSAVGDMVTYISKNGVSLPGPGRYKAVVTSVSGDLKEESLPSNEIEFTWGNQTPVQPPMPSPKPPPKVIPPVASLPPPIPWPSKPPAAGLPPVPSAGGSGRLTDTETWTGRGATLPPVSQMPSLTGKSDRLTDTCVWQGKPCP